jgi:hypothetical protein
MFAAKQSLPKSLPFGVSKALSDDLQAVVIVSKG